LVDDLKKPNKEMYGGRGSYVKNKSVFVRRKCQLYVCSLISFIRN
jgi:hypothetical protein